jgi:hypothetical protein
MAAKDRKPAYKVVFKDERDFWHTLGVAFETTAKGERALSLKLNVVPTNWNGDALLVPWKDNEGAGD